MWLQGYLPDLEAELLFSEDNRMGSFCEGGNEVAGFLARSGAEWQALFPDNGTQST
jgi:hypothetical protein